MLVGGRGCHTFRFVFRGGCHAFNFSVDQNSSGPHPLIINEHSLTHEIQSTVLYYVINVTESNIYKYIIHHISSPLKDSKACHFYA